jgi:hypothetical protein
MKTRMIFFVMLIGSVNIYSQEYKKLVTAGNKWNYLYELYTTCYKSSNSNQYFPECGGGESRTYSLYLSEDTIIDTVQYVKVLCNIIKYNGNEIVYAGAIREDTINQKVFIKLPDQEESLLYTFNEKVGDTIAIDTSVFKDVFTIRYIKSVGIFNFNGFIGKKISICDTVKRVIPSIKMPPYESFTDDWYEGIGSLKTLFDLQNLGVPEGFTKLLCFWNNENKIYTNPDWTICEYTDWVGIKEQELKSVINIYPIPASQKLMIDTKFPIEKIELLDLNGKLLITTKALNFDISNINNGFYILNVYFKSGERTTRKLIKNAL